LQWSQPLAAWVQLISVSLTEIKNPRFGGVFFAGKSGPVATLSSAVFSEE